MTFSATERSNKIARNLRINERIRVREVRVIDENNEQLGVMPTRDAMSLAQSRGLDLVEVAPTAQPPVCRLMDYGKFRYDQGKRDRDARKTQKTISIKELRLYPKIGEHDIDTRAKAAKRFLEEGHKVKLVVQFKGRENAHPELGREMLLDMIERLREVGIVEQAPRQEGRNMSTILIQRTDRARTAPRPPRPEATAGEGQTDAAVAPAAPDAAATATEPTAAPASQAEPTTAPPAPTAAPATNPAPPPAPVAASPTEPTAAPPITPVPTDSNAATPPPPRPRSRAKANTEPTA